MIEFYCLYKISPENWSHGIENCTTESGFLLNWIQIKLFSTKISPQKTNCQSKKGKKTYTVPIKNINNLISPHRGFLNAFFLFLLKNIFHQIKIKKAFCELFWSSFSSYKSSSPSPTLSCSSSVGNSSVCFLGTNVGMLWQSLPLQDGHVYQSM